ncbi:MAG: hypothetical protein JO210_00865 [Acidobacteriaceae bacterium]|nr:hypothetical protein [Acidobacteriaceae bacterium]
MRRDGEGAPGRAALAEAIKSGILASEGFVHSGRMRSFFAFIVEEALVGRGSQLCEYSIGVSVFGRDESFDPGLDPIVRNDARGLRQKADRVLPRAAPWGSGD